MAILWKVQVIKFTDGLEMEIERVKKNSLKKIFLSSFSLNIEQDGMAIYRGKKDC